MKSTNYLNPTMFYGDYLDYLVLLDEFHNDDCPPPMTADKFYFEERIGYGSALRVTERLNLIKEDFDLDHRILKIWYPKTKKSGYQKTTILPYDVKPIERFLNKFSDSDRLFPVTRSTVWRYCKNASILGGLNIFEAKDEIEINGAWTHLLRSSCSKMYEDAGAKHSLVQKKMRHGGRDVTDRYTKVDLNTLLDWEEEHLHTCLAHPILEKPILEVVQ